MKPADLAEWAVISKLLDEAIDLPNAERGAWIERLAPEHAHLKPHLAELLAASALSDTSIPALPQYTGDSTITGGAFKAGQRIATYTLIRPIGKGGMGSVWLAEASESAVKIPVAIKLPHVSTLTNAGYLRERFARERVILAALNHPNIARLHEAGVTIEGQPFLALEYIDGDTILTHCNNARLSVNSRLALFVQVLKALQYAHANLIIHRDLKPSNIIITRTGDVKLLDFGIAKLLDTESQAAEETALTQMGGRAMTPDYASPEQIRGESLTTASDVYSSGVLLYELLTGKRPYKLKRGSRAELEEAILTSDISRPSTMVGDDFATETSNSRNRLKRKLAGDLDTIVIKALKKNADERYPSAQALQNDIERYLNGQPVLAQADSASYRFKKFISRNRLVAAATASVFLALTAGLGIALWQASAAKEQAKIAKQETARAEAVKKFLVSLLDRNSRFEKDPAAARAMSVQDLLLKEALPKLRKSFDDQPEIKVELLATVARLLSELDRRRESLDLWREADTLATQTSGISNKLRLDILSERAIHAQWGGERTEVQDTRDRMIAIADRVNDPTEHFKMRAYSMGSGRPGAKRDVEEQRMLEALRIAETRFPNDVEHFAVHYRLGHFYNSAANWAKTTHHLTRALELYSSTVDPSPAMAADAQGVLAYALAATGESDKSLRMFDTSIASWERLGGNIQALRLIRANYAGVLAYVGRNEDAKREYQKIADSYSPNHIPEAADYHVNMQEALMVLSEGRPDAALKVLARFPEPAAKVNPLTASLTFLCKAVALELLGDSDAANDAFSRVTKLNEGTGDALMTLTVIKTLTVPIALLRNDADWALRVLLLKDSSINTNLPLPTNFDDDFVLLNVKAATSYATKGDVPSAKRSISRAQANLALVKAGAGAIDTAAELAKAHGHVLLADADFAGAVAQLQNALKAQEKTQAPTSPFLMETRLNLAEALARSGNKVEAKALCERVKADVKTYATLHPWFTKRLKAVTALL